MEGSSLQKSTVFGVMFLIAVTGLVNIVSSGNEISHERIVRIPSNVLGEIYSVCIPENILVTHVSPNMQSFCNSFFDGSHLGKWNKILNGRIHDVGLMCSDALVWHVRGKFLKWVGKVFRYGHRENVSLYPYAYSASRSTACINQKWSRLKLKIGLPRPPLLLPESMSDSNCEISANDGLIAYLNGSGNFFHCVGRSCGLSNVALHGPALFSSSFNGFPQLYSLVKVNAKLSKGDNRQNSRKDYDPPVARRFLLAVSGFLLSFCLTPFGLKCLDHKRRLLGSALIGWLLGGLELLLLWPTHFLWSWGWIF
jgi:hypothetical protein